MSFSDTVNSSKSLFNPSKSIQNEFIFQSDCDFYSLVFSFFKNFSTYIISPQSKIKFDPKIFDAKNDLNIAVIYEKEGKLLIKSGQYTNEFDDFFTKVNRHIEQKRKIRQSLKNGSLVYEVPLFKTINLNDLNEKVYEDIIFSREYKYDYIGNIFYPLNDTRLDKDENIIFKLNQKSKYYNKGALVVLENLKNEYNEEKNEEIDEDMNDSENINQNDSKDDNINDENLLYFKNNEIMLEITKYDNFIQENISLFLLNLSNNNNQENKNKNLNSIKDVLNSTENPHLLDAINHFNNIFTPELYNKFSLYKNIKINNHSQILSEINSVLNLEEENNNIKPKNNKLILDEDESGNNLVNNIKKYFDEETVKEINKDIEITQNFTHFYIEGNTFNKDNWKKIISFLNKENFYIIAWKYNKEQTKKFGIINNIMKVYNLSNKIWFYINTKKTNEDIQ